MTPLKVLGIALIISAFFLGFNIPTWFETKTTNVEQLLILAKDLNASVSIDMVSTQEFPKGNIYKEISVDSAYITNDETTMYSIITIDGIYLGEFFVHAAKYD